MNFIVIITVIIITVIITIAIIIFHSYYMGSNVTLK